MWIASAVVPSGLFRAIDLAHGMGGCPPIDLALLDSGAGGSAPILGEEDFDATTWGEIGASGAYGYDIADLLARPYHFQWDVACMLDRFTDHDEDWILSPTRRAIAVLKSARYDESGYFPKHRATTSRWAIQPVPFTTVLMGSLCLVTYALQIMKGEEFTLSVIFHTPSILGGQLHRIFTSTFAHGDLEHIFNNMVGLLLTGPRCEEVYGSLRMVEATLCAIILNGISMMIFLPHKSSLGFSGVLYFYYSMNYWAVERSNAKFWVRARLFQELKNVALRDTSMYSALAHLFGGINGFLYSHFIMDSIRIPTSILRRVDKRLDRVMDKVRTLIGIENPRWLEVLHTPDDDDGGSADCDDFVPDDDESYDDDDSSSDDYMDIVLSSDYDDTDGYESYEAEEY